MEGKELRIPIAGVIEEAAFVSNTCSLLEYYPQGEGLYLVKNPTVAGSCARCLVATWTGTAERDVL